MTSDIYETEIVQKEERLTSSFGQLALESDFFGIRLRSGDLMVFIW